MEHFLEFLGALACIAAPVAFVLGSRLTSLFVDAMLPFYKGGKEPFEVERQTRRDKIRHLILAVLANGDPKTVSRQSPAANEPTSIFDDLRNLRLVAWPPELFDVMGGLVRDGLVTETGDPDFYALTNDGRNYVQVQGISKRAVEAVTTPS